MTLRLPMTPYMHGSYSVGLMAERDWLAAPGVPHDGRITGKMHVHCEEEVELLFQTKETRQRPNLLPSEGITLDVGTSDVDLVLDSRRRAIQS